jgi:hypothetical protein
MADDRFRTPLRENGAMTVMAVSVWGLNNKETKNSPKCFPSSAVFIVKTYG